ncbi:MAG TPA: hypothetical protein VFZ61_19635, partial [Polyangiales bacterium]
MFRKSVLGTAGLLALAAIGGVHGCAEEKGSDIASETGSIGEVGLKLTLPDGVTINSVNYTVTGGPSSVTRSGTVDVTNSNVLRFRVGNLPVGAGYNISLSASTNGGDSCASSAGFTVENNVVTAVTMTLTCGGGVVIQPDNGGDLNVNAQVVVDAGVSCPVATGVSSLPLEVLTNSALDLTGYASSTSSSIVYAWSGQGGSFSSTNTAATSYTCQTPGLHSLTFSITSPGCTTPSSVNVEIECSAHAPYVVPVATGVLVRTIATVGESYNNRPDGSPYRMVGIPDGAGAFDNGDGTFTMLVNHELGATQGIARAHGGAGSFVSRWQIRKSDLRPVNGADLIQSVNLWSPGSSSYTPGTNVAFGRFCSADLGATSAFYNAGNSLGFNGQLFLNGEETGAEGRAMAHGLDGVSYELPRLGKASWENQVASPFAQDKTIVVGLDDSTPGEVYVYVGTKTNSGSAIERAGLTNGNLYGVAVTGFATEPQAGGIPSAPFTLANHGNVENTTGAALQLLDNAAGVTKWNRPEDGAWDPANPADFYFVTTNSATSPSRLWRLRFTNISQPELGGTVTMLLDGTEGHVMLDNIGLDTRGHIMLQEDVGGNARLGRIYRYDIATDGISLVAEHNPALFTSGAAGFITQDEEASGIIDATTILGAGWWLMTDQIHGNIGGELVERGQL